jgi:hypothetical protein
MTFFEIHMHTHLDPMKRVVEMLRDDTGTTETVVAFAATKCRVLSAVGADPLWRSTQNVRCALLVVSTRVVADAPGTLAALLMKGSNDECWCCADPVDPRRSIWVRVSPVPDLQIRLEILCLNGGQRRFWIWVICERRKIIIN